MKSGHHLCKVTLKICSHGCVGNLYFLGGLCTPSVSHSAKYCFTNPFQAKVTQVLGVVVVVPEG